jgi:hypothetical protein
MDFQHAGWQRFFGTCWKMGGKFGLERGQAQEKDTHASESRTYSDGLSKTSCIERRMGLMNKYRILLLVPPFQLCINLAATVIAVLSLLPTLVVQKCTPTPPLPL